MSNFTGGGFGCNPKYIALELLRRGGYEIVWLVDHRRPVDMSAFPKAIKTVEYYSFKAYWALATAKYWVGNEVTSLPVPKKQQQVYIMTWHGGFATKKVGLAANFCDEAVRVMEKCAIAANYYISMCAEDDRVYRQSLMYYGDVLAIGAPRCDILFDVDARFAIRERLGFSKDEKIIIYAPTWRVHKGAKIINGAPTWRVHTDLNMYDLDYALVRGAFAKLFNTQKVKMLIRLHPHMWRMFDTLKVPPFVQDVTEYPDMQELLCAADVLITDYSSTPFEFILTRRPIFLYASDIDDYVAHENGVKYLPNQLPFEYGYSNEELCRKIESFDYDAYKKRIELFMQENKYYGDGHAAKAVADIMKV